MSANLCPRLHGLTGRTGCRMQALHVGFPLIFSATCIRADGLRCNAPPWAPFIAEDPTK